MDSDSVGIMIGEQAGKIDCAQGMIVAKEFQQIEWDAPRRTIVAI